LYVLVQPTGRKGFAFRYRFGGKPRKLTFAAGLSLAEARKAAAEAALAIAQGRDPGEAKRAAQDKAAAASANTVRSIAEEYLKREGHKIRTRRQREGLLAQHIFPAFGDRPIGSLKRSELVRFAEKVEDVSGVRTAEVVLAILRRITAWHAIRDDDFTPPFVRGMGRVATRARSRILSDDEIRRLWGATATGTFGALVRFLLLTGARRGEAAAMQWSELAGGVWALPARRNKTGLDFERPLSRAALAIIDGQARVVGCEFIFSLDFRGPLGGFSKQKGRLDSFCGVVDWRLHDLRRTARSLLARAGVSADIGERFLGHVVGGVRGVYDRHKYLDEMHAAGECLAALIERILDPREDNIVPIRR
jgi:integrase